MANLDKLLRKVEKNTAEKIEVKTYNYEVDGESFEVYTLDPNDRRELVYAISDPDLTQKERVKTMIPYIYRSFKLNTLASQAKDAGYIKSYYDIVETLFKPEDIFKIMGFIFQVNNIYGATLDKEIDAVKK